MLQFTPLEITALVLLGLIALRVVFYILSVVYIYFLGPAITRTDFKSMGKWALITGSTDGVGKQYARELAARGCNIILLSRTLDKLKAVAGELEKDFKVATMVVQADLTKIDELYDHISNEVKDLEIGILVNNAGLTYPYPESFLDVPDRDKVLSDIVNVNIVTPTQLIGLVMPGMVKRRRGIIINIGSLFSRAPSPLLALYGASKAYIDKFTETLQLEYKKSGIIIQNVYPGAVFTNMSASFGVDKKSIVAPVAAAYTKSAVRMVGVVSSTSGYIGHSFLKAALDIMNCISSRLVNLMLLRHMEDSRKRALMNLNHVA